MSSVDRCLCCSVRQGALVAANYFVIAYCAACGVTVWWMMENRGVLPAGAYILLGLYFLMLVFSIFLVLSLAVQRRPSVLLAWMLLICIFFVPECGLNLWVCVWGLGVATTKGLGFLIFYTFRAVINILGIVCVNFAYMSFKTDQEALEEKIHQAYGASFYGFPVAPSTDWHYFNCTPHIALFTADHQPYVQSAYGMGPYPVASPMSFNDWGIADCRPPTAGPRPLAAGRLVRHRIGCPSGKRVKSKGQNEISSTNERADEKLRMETDVDATGKRVTGGQSCHSTSCLPLEPYGSTNRTPSVYMVDPGRCGYPVLPPQLAALPRPHPQPVPYCPAPLSPCALAYAALNVPHPAHFNYPHLPLARSNDCLYQLPFACNWLKAGTGQAGGWRSYGLHPSKRTPPCALYPATETPMPPCAVFDYPAPDVEPSFVNFIMRQRKVGDLTTFRPKALFEENKKTGQRDYNCKKRRLKTEAAHRLCTHQSSDSPNRSHRRPDNQRRKSTSRKNHPNVNQ